jgi:osmotically-inducible protein OsmY
MRRLLATALVFSAFSVSGCVPLVLGGAATGGVMAAQDRGFEQGVDDNEIAFEINRKLAQKDNELFKRVSTQVRSGRVVLTGFVRNEQDSADVSRIAWTVSGVKQVDNELQVGAPTTFAEKTSDTFITTKVRTQITADEAVSGINYSIKTIRGTVYLSGTARNQAELDRVVAHARGVSGVRNVVSNVQVKSTSQQ